MINIRTHRTDHVRQTSCLGQIGDDLTTLDTGVVILVNEQGFDDNQDSVGVWADKIVQLVQDTINDLDQQMAFLILERLLHEQGENLVEEWSCTEVTSIVCELAQSRLPHRWCTVLDFQQQAHDLSLLQLFHTKVVLVCAVN